MEYVAQYMITDTRTNEENLYFKVASFYIGLYDDNHNINGFYVQRNAKYKHYGKLIIMLIKECLKIKDGDVKKNTLEQIAEQMKRSYLNWNRTNVQDSQIWDDLERLANTKLNLDKSKIIPVFQTNTNTTRKKTFYKKSNRKNYSRK